MASNAREAAYTARERRLRCWPRRDNRICEDATNRRPYLVTWTAGSEW